MEIIISNKIRVKNAPDILQDLLVKKLKIPNPKFSEAENSGRSTFGIDRDILNFTVMPDDSLLVPRGIIRWLIEKTINLKISYNVIDKRKIFGHITLDTSKINYLPYQLPAVATLTTYSNGVLVSPAGSGKTIMGISIIPIVGQPVLWLTHTNQLAVQTKERLESFFPDIGIIGTIGDGKWEKGDVATIGMVQTLIRNPERLIEEKDSWGLVILDEAHHCPARTFIDVVSNLNPYFMYGLTATPYRRDKLEELMFQTLGETKVIIPIEEVAKHGGIIIPKVRYRAINSKRIISNNTSAILKNLLSNKNRNLAIVSDVIAEATSGHFCIVISDRKEHCEILYQLISAGWEKTGIATGDYSKKYVSEQVERLNKEITVLVTTFSLLGEGFDAPFLDRAFIALPFRAEAKAEQLIGRIQRTFPGKKDSVVYDYVDVDIGVLENQFFSKNKDCRYRTYARLGVQVEPY